MQDRELLSSLLEASGADAFFDTAPADFPQTSDTPTVTQVLTTLDGQNLLARITDAVLAEKEGMLSYLGTFGGLLLLCALWRKYRMSVHGDNDGIGEQIPTLIIALSAFSLFSDLLSVTGQFFTAVHSQMTAALTTLTTLCAMRGCISAATVSGVGMSFFFAAAETITVGILPTFLRLCAGISLVSFVGGDTGIGGFDALSGLLRRQFLWITGALMTVLCAVLSYQTVLARAADSLSMRAVKFTLSGMIPVVGGAVSEAVSTVSAGFSLAAKTVGMLGIAWILWQILPPLCTLLLARAVFSLSAVFASMMGLAREEGILRECASLVGFLCAVSAAVSVFYILSMTVCMKGVM